MKRVFKFLVWMISICLLAGLASTIIYGYQSTMTSLIHSIGESDRADKILELVSASKFFVLQISIVVVCIGLILTHVFIDKIWHFLAKCVFYIQKNMNALYLDVSRTELKWILIIPFFSAVFFAIYLPVSYDEAWTYLHLTSKSPLASLCYYPAPNNHVLHSLITNVTRYIPFVGPLFCLRVSSIIISFMTWVLCFSFIKKYYSESIALIITSISSMLFMTIYYSYMSRGYGLVMLFFILSTYAAFNIIYKENRIKDWACFACSNILGFITMPSFLYPFIILNAIILLNNKFKIKQQIVFNLLTLISVALLYLPIIIVNGLDAIINNRFVAPISRGEVLGQLLIFSSETITDIFGFNYVFVIVACIVAVSLLIKNKMMFELQLALIFISAPFLLLIAHSVIPFYRIFNYYAFVLVFLIFIPYFKWIKKVPVKYVLCFIFLIQILCFINFYTHIKKYEKFNITYHEINKKIVGNKSYFFTTVLFETNFMFENEACGYKVTKADFNFPQINVDADTLTGFDYYIVDKQYDFTKNKKPAYSDSRTNVYAK